MFPPTCPARKISGGQQEEGHGVAHHVQWEHHQSYFLHHSQNASIMGRQIQCSKDQMQVSYVEMNNVGQSSTVPNSQSIKSTLTIPWAWPYRPPSLVCSLYLVFGIQSKSSIRPNTDWHSYFWRNKKQLLDRKSLRPCMSKSMGTF